MRFQMKMPVHDFRTSGRSRFHLTFIFHQLFYKGRLLKCNSTSKQTVKIKSQTLNKWQFPELIKTIWCIPGIPLWRCPFDESKLSCVFPISLDPTRWCYWMRILTCQHEIFWAVYSSHLCATQSLDFHCKPDLPKWPCFCFVQPLQLAKCQTDCSQT